MYDRTEMATTEAESRSEHNSEFIAEHPLVTAVHDGLAWWYHVDCSDVDEFSVDEQQFLDPAMARSELTVAGIDTEGYYVRSIPEAYQDEIGYRNPDGEHESEATEVLP